MIFILQKGGIKMLDINRIRNNSKEVETLLKNVNLPQRSEEKVHIPLDI